MRLYICTGLVHIYNFILFSGSRHAERVDVFGAAPHNFVGE